MELVATTAYLVTYSIALLVLISLGLAVIFGMMKVINLAHGEFMMLGAYACVFSGNAGAPLWAAAVMSAVLVGAFGVLVERLIIKFLYGRIIDTLLATWGLSLFLVGGVTTVFGPQGRSSRQAGNVSFGGVSLSAYNLILIGVTAAVAVLTAVLARSQIGLIVRGTMQEPERSPARSGPIAASPIWRLSDMGRPLPGLPARCSLDDQGRLTRDDKTSLRLGSAPWQRRYEPGCAGPEGMSDRVFRMPLKHLRFCGSNRGPSRVALLSSTEAQCAEGHQVILAGR